jgi:FKBP-type peptidyl-prolyl cis-trans isomerase
MQVSEKRLVALPYWLAYGEKGQRGKIPGKAALLLEIELVAINPAPVAPASPGGS